MIRLFEGSFNSGVRDELKAAIKKNIQDKKQTLLIVPEQQTVSAEKEFAEQLPQNAPLYFEVTNFTRLANTVFRRLGGIQKKYADSVIKSLIMWQTLTELSPVLSMTSGRREISIALTERALSAVKEAEASGLDTAALAEAAENSSLGSRLCKKLSDLSKITALYKEKLRTDFSDTADDSALLVEKLRKNKDFLSDTEFFIEGFTSFTVPQYGIIAELLLHSDITVALNVPKSDSGAYEYSEPLSTRAKLSALSDKKGADKKIYKFDGRKNVKSDALFELCPLLWKPNRKIEGFKLSSGEDIRLFEARSPFEECEFIASDIRRRVMAGASYRDFAVVTENSSDYCGILEMSLDKADIAHFSSEKTSLCEFEAIKLIFAAITASKSFSLPDVKAYASCGLSGVSADEYCEFEMYLEKWQISGARFTDSLVWNMNPLGFESRKLPDHDEVLSRIDATRVKLITPLVHLRDAFSRAVSIREHAAALFSFLEETELEDALVRRSARLAELGEKTAAQDSLKLYCAICKALDTLVGTVGDSPTDTDGFAAQLKIVFASSQIGRIPSSFDEVTVGTAQMLRLREKKHIYLLGVNYGKFPAPSTNTGYFTDRECEMLAALGLESDGGAQMRQSRALFAFSRVFAAAEESITISYPVKDTSFCTLSPSFVIENITALTDGAVSVKKIADVPPRDKFYAIGIASEALNECKAQTKKELKETLRELGCARVFSESDKIDNGSLDFSGIKTQEPLYLTQTRIDSFVSCPLKYFCTFTLSLNENKRAKFGLNTVGSYIHAILENFFSEAKHGNLNIAELGEEEKSEMTKRAAKAYLDCYSSELDSSGERTKSALSKIYRAARPIVDDVCRELENSKFEPAFFELPISRIKDDGPTPVEISGEHGEKIRVYGTIDRVDTYKRGEDVYVRVVDYKTGSKDFNPEKIKDGVNLQMFLYLKSVIECEKPSFKRALGVGKDGKALPAGLIYIKTDLDEKRAASPEEALAISAQKKPKKRMGMVLFDDEILSAMGKDFLPVKYSKSGIHKSYEKFLFTADGWSDISKSVEEAVGKIGSRIARGEIRAASGKEAKQKAPCEHCAYKAFCRNIKL